VLLEDDDRPTQLRELDAGAEPRVPRPDHDRIDLFG
jgi:hypothetical protein